MSKEQTLRVWGDLACFTRAEMKVERFSYPVITPSASRGIFDAIYCKPCEFRWQITKIEILAPLRWIALRRNEVSEIAKLSGTGQERAIFADDERVRQQRQTLALQNVHYLLHARIVPWRGFDHRLPAFEHQFRRRAAHGKCFFQPYFGCREFPAYFELAENNADHPIPLDIAIGPMLYDTFDLSQPNASDASASISLFKAEVVGGRLIVPDWCDAAVLKLKGGTSIASPNS